MATASTRIAFAASPAPDAQNALAELTAAWGQHTLDGAEEGDDVQPVEGERVHAVIIQPGR